MTFDTTNLKDANGQVRADAYIEYPIEGGFKVRGAADGYHLIEAGKDNVRLHSGHEHWGAARQGFKKSFGAVNAAVDQEAVGIIDQGIVKHLRDESAPNFFAAEEATLEHAKSLDKLVNGKTATNPLSRNGVREGAAIMAHDGQAVHFISNNHYNTLNDVKAVNKVGMESIAANYRTATESLEALVKNGGYERKQIEDIIAKAGPGFENYLNGSKKEIVDAFLHPGPTPKGGKALAVVHLDDVFKDVNTKAANFQREAVKLATEVQELHEVAMPNGKKAAWDATGKAEKVKLKIAELDKLGKDNAAYTAHIDEALESRFGKEGLAELRKIPNMEATLSGISKASGVASEAGKSGQSFLSGLLFKNWEKQEALAVTKGKVGREALTFVEKVHGGKAAAILGLGAIGTYFVAGIGKNRDQAQGRYTGPAIANDNEMQTGAVATR